MRRHWLSGLMLLLAVSGLLLMHGPDAAGHGSVHHGTERAETAMPHHDVASSMSASQPGETSTAAIGADASAAQGWSQVVALCMAVLAVAMTGLVHRLLSRVRRSRLEPGAPRSTTWRVRRSGTARPPGRSHLVLCVQLC